MNRTDAATILSIDPSASPDEAKRAYQELFTEHQVRLTNAPTPALRSLYQSRLLELEEARDAFLAASVSDADSDLPTDQPSIPAYRAADQAGRETFTRPSTPPPPPPAENKPLSRQRSEEPAIPAAKAEAAAPPTAPKKSGAVRLAGIGAAVIVVLLVIGKLFLLPSGGAGNANGITPDSSARAPHASGVADSLPKIRESITVAKVEFGRGDYDAANVALKDADSVYAHISGGARGDSATAQLKAQVDSLHGKVGRACDALKKVAARHPGEPTCKSL